MSDCSLRHKDDKRGQERDAAAAERRFKKCFGIVGAQSP